LAQAFFYGFCCNGNARDKSAHLQISLNADIAALVNAVREGLKGGGMGKQAIFRLPHRLCRGRDGGRMGEVNSDSTRV